MSTGDSATSSLKAVRRLLGETLGIADGRLALMHAGSPLLGSVPELDSAAVIQVIAGLEDTFGITVDDDEIDASMFDTIGSLADFVDRKLAG
jgi:acyl carrier protein